MGEVNLVEEIVGNALKLLLCGLIFGLSSECHSDSKGKQG
jgi:hypothetical protein